VATVHSFQVSRQSALYRGIIASQKVARSMHGNVAPSKWNDCRHTSTQWHSI